VELLVRLDAYCSNASFFIAAPLASSLLRLDQPSNAQSLDLKIIDRKFANAPFANNKASDCHAPERESTERQGSG
jgi:hypothetical protein